MTATITCPAHGSQPETFVCVHIIEGMEAGEARGFWYSKNPDGVYDAVCGACDALSQDDFDALGPENIKVICFGCFKEAAALNDIDIK
ncbi:MAG: hypothetical protein AAGC77_04130 [Pseudomonadota bacterium]